MILKLNVFRIKIKRSKYDNFGIFIPIPNFQGLSFLLGFLVFLEPMQSNCRHVLVPNPYTRNLSGFLLSMYLQAKRKLLPKCLSARYLRQFLIHFSSFMQ
jgi:hypothetical protein